MDSNAPVSAELARRMIGLVDLTRLESTDTTDASEAEAIRALCRKANTPAGPVAAVCVHPAWVELADYTLRDAGNRQIVRLATVANFPEGSGSVDGTVATIKAALVDGADEIDVVLPWRELTDGDRESVQQLLAASRMACSNHCMKVILESGELDEPELIRQASEIAIACGADFLKTSTGKVPVNATMAAATIMLGTLRDTNRKVGFKASGGLRTAQDAATYLSLAEQMLGTDWIGPDHLRFGASSLLDDLLAHARSSDTQ
ncbi:MAG: deoxyribose-phosphate aldolase [Pseudomonadota bacterium]